MIRTTKEQRKAIHQRWLLLGSQRAMTYREFRGTIQPTFGCDGAVALQWCGMWLCIERNGYTHS